MLPRHRWSRQLGQSYYPALQIWKFGGALTHSFLECSSEPPHGGKVLADVLHR